MFNAIGDYLAKGARHYPTHILTHSFPASSPLVGEGIFVNDPTSVISVTTCPVCGCVNTDNVKACQKCGTPIPQQPKEPCGGPMKLSFSPTGLEQFIGRFFQCGQRISHSGNVCCYGSIRNRQLYYSPDPKPNFFSLHGDDTSVILGSNDAMPPTGWGGKAVLLSELFYVDDAQNKIDINPGPFRRLFPEKKSHPRFSRKRMNKRRTQWLQFFLDYITAIRQTDAAKPKQKYTRPSFKKVRNWFVANFAGASKCPRTYRRDIDEMTASSKAMGTYDKRDEIVRAIWVQLDDPKFLFAKKTCDVIVNELAKVKAKETDASTSSLSGSKAAWETGGRTISVAPALDVDKDLRAL